jgi:hypothetical protein
MAAANEGHAVIVGRGSVSSSVTVNENETLIDPHGAGNANRVGQDTIDHRLTSLPGRAVVDLVNSQPG